MEEGFGYDLWSVKAIKRGKGQLVPKLKMANVSSKRDGFNLKYLCLLKG